MAVLSNGNVAVTWSTGADISPGADGAGKAQFVRVFNANGAPVNPSLVAPNAVINPCRTGDQVGGMIVALAGGDFAASWNSINGPGDTFALPDGRGGDAWVQVFDNAGTRAAFRPPSC